MSGFFYFTPRIANAADYVPLGLAYAFDAAPTVTQLGGKDGPEGLSGTVLHNWPGPTLPERIKWHKARDEIYVGYTPAAPPKPAQLRTDVELGAGFVYRLADGEDWAVPRVLACTERDPERACGLPQICSDSDDDGQMRWTVIERYQPLIDQAQTFLEALRIDCGGIVEPESVQRFGLAVALLGVGYRVSAAEVCALGLLEAEKIDAICIDAVDGIERLKAEASPQDCDWLDGVDCESWLYVVAGQRVQREAI